MAQSPSQVLSPGTLESCPMTHLSTRGQLAHTLVTLAYGQAFDKGPQDYGALKGTYSSLLLIESDD